MLLNVQDIQKVIKDVAENSSTLITWALSLSAAGILAIISTSYVKPENKKVKLIYLIFLPGWILSAASIFYGESIQRKNIAAEINVSPDGVVSVFGDVNDAYGWQILLFEVGLVCFALWLISYFFWWIFKT